MRRRPLQPQTFAKVTFEQYRTPARRERFLDEMNCVVLWTELAVAIASSISRLRVLASTSGLRLHCLQQWFNLSDQAAALYDSRALRQFVGIDLGLDPQNRRKEWDPEMHQTKKDTQWYFVMKAHLGVNRQTKLIYAVAATAATAHDSQGSPDLLHGQEARVWR